MPWWRLTHATSIQHPVPHTHSGYWTLLEQCFSCNITNETTCPFHSRLLFLSPLMNKFKTYSAYFSNLIWCVRPEKIMSLMRILSSYITLEHQHLLTEDKFFFPQLTAKCKCIIDAKMVCLSLMSFLWLFFFILRHDYFISRWFICQYTAQGCITTWKFVNSFILRKQRTYIQWFIYMDFIEFTSGFI